MCDVSTVEWIEGGGGDDAGPVVINQRPLGTVAEIYNRKESDGAAGSEPLFRRIGYLEARGRGGGGDAADAKGEDVKAKKAQSSDSVSLVTPRLHKKGGVESKATMSSNVIKMLRLNVTVAPKG